LFRDSNWLCSELFFHNMTGFQVKDNPQVLFFFKNFVETSVGFYGHTWENRALDHNLALVMGLEFVPEVQENFLWSMAFR